MTAPANADVGSALYRIMRALEHCDEYHLTLIERFVASSAKPTPFIDIVFDGPPGPEAGRFVEVENAEGKSVSIGEWLHVENDKFWRLRIRLWGDVVAMLQLLKDILSELESEAEQRETSGNDEYSKGIRALADRVRAIVGDKQ